MSCASPASWPATRMGEADHLRRAMGKKIPAEMIAAAREIHRRARARRASCHRVAETDFRAGGEVRRLWLQQGPCRGLCPGRLSDRLSEGELSGRIPRRLDDARYRQHRPAQHLPPGSAAAGRQGGCRPTSTAREAVFACDAEANVVFYALAAVKGVGRQAMDHVVEMRQAGGPFKILSRFRRAASIPGWSTSAPSKIWCAPAPSTRSIRNRRQLVEIPTASWAARRRAQRERESGQVTPVRRRRRAARNCA